jgi:hypothetical protein
MSKAASAVALRKGLWRDKQGFSAEAYFSTSPRQIHAGQEGGNPRPPAPLPARRAYRPEGRAYASERERRSSEK